MNPTYVEDNKKAIDRIVQEMTLEFRNRQKEFLPKIQTTEPGEVVVTRERKGRPPRYGVKLTQEAENYVYKYVRVLQQILRQSYDIENYVVEREALDIMCIHVLKRVYENCDIPFETRYGEAVDKSMRSGKIKLVGLIFLLFILLVAIVAGIIWGRE